MTIRILAFAGSSRRDSVNRRILDSAIAGATDAGADVTTLRLAELELPIYDGDLEAGGLPAGAIRFQELIAAHHALLIASPEYNGGYTPLLKNAIDWASRTATSPGPDPFKGKLAAIVSASPGLLGGIRAQVSLLPVLHKLGVHVIPASFALGSADRLFDEDGTLTDRAAHAGLHGVGVALVEATKRFTALGGAEIRKEGAS